MTWTTVPIRVLNGPNLGRLGTREPHLYVTTSYTDLVHRCETTAAQVGLAVTIDQTDAEATMLSWLHNAADTGAAVILNAAAWTHTSVAIRDAALGITGPLLEVHISNVYAREPFRRTSYLSDIATGVIVGLGLGSYDAALRWLADHRDTTTPDAPQNPSQAITSAPPGTKKARPQHG